MYRFALKVFTFIFVLFSLCSCAAIKPAPDEKSLRERAEKLWIAKVEGDSVTMYNMTVKAFREKVELKKFSKAPLMDFKSFSIKNIEVDPPEGVVTVDYRIVYQGFDFDSVAKESWLFEDGQWLLNLKPSKMPF
jgi:hypothetical protein